MPAFEVCIHHSDSAKPYMMQDCCGFRGVHLRDLVLSNTALPDRLDGDIINFRKMAQMSNIFRDLLILQNLSCPVQGNMDLVNTIRVGAVS